MPLNLPATAMRAYTDIPRTNYILETADHRQEKSHVLYCTAEINKYLFKDSET
jgi:hypothetical protein